MKVILESTEKIVTLGGVECRVWEGHTELSGISVHAFIPRIATPKEADQDEFKSELEQCIPPSAAIMSYPAKMII